MLKQVAGVGGQKASSQDTRSSNNASGDRRCINKSGNLGLGHGTDPGDRSESSLNLSTELQKIRKEVDRDCENIESSQISGLTGALEASGTLALDRLTDFSNLDTHS